MFTVILYFVDFSIFAAVVVAVQGKGGVAIFYLLRAGFVIAAAPDHSVSRSLLPAVVVFALLRTGEVVIDHLFLLSVKTNNNTSNEEREMLRNKHKKGKFFFLVLLTATLLMFTFAVTLVADGLFPGLLFVGCVVTLVIELRKTVGLPIYVTRVVQSSLHMK